ncbi:MAG: enoyl-CoA hydratase/isomerase family protein [Ignavibacteria bacterium]|nr:enoyl-CoA hydratase/isomerase family protein [Ignavibacteria bacterium]
MAYNSILTGKKDSVLYITLNRPDVYNAFNDEMTYELQDAFRNEAISDDVRCVVITGAGKAFCSGQDLKDFTDKKSTFKEALDKRYNPLIKLITGLPKPVIASLNGVAAGAGLSLALACDYRIAVESATLIEVFINVGLVPDSGSSFYLLKILGYAKAFELCASGDKVTAKEAKELGLVNKVVSSGALLKKITEQTANNFAAKPTFAIGLIKDLLRKAAYQSLDEILELEAKHQENAGNSADFKEGVAAFLEKRKPKFTGK